MHQYYRRGQVGFFEYPVVSLHHQFTAVAADGLPTYGDGGIVKRSESREQKTATVERLAKELNTA